MTRKNFKITDYINAGDTIRFSPKKDTHSRKGSVATVLDNGLLQSDTGRIYTLAEITAMYLGYAANAYHSHTVWVHEGTGQCLYDLRVEILGEEGALKKPVSRYVPRAERAGKVYDHANPKAKVKARIGSQFRRINKGNPPLLEISEYVPVGETIVFEPTRDSALTGTRLTVCPNGRVKSSYGIEYALSTYMRDFMGISYNSDATLRQWKYNGVSLYDLREEMMEDISAVA